MRRSVLLLIASFFVGASASLDWVSHPVGAGEWALLSGDFRAGVESIELSGLGENASSNFSTPAIDVSDSALKFKLPAAGAFNVSIKGRSGAIPVNAPEVWWFQGDGGDTASPGGWLRVFGRSLGHASKEEDAATKISSAISAGDFAAAHAFVQQAAKKAAEAQEASPLGTWLRLTSAGGETLQIAARTANTTAYHALFSLPESSFIDYN